MKNLALALALLIPGSCLAASPTPLPSAEAFIGKFGQPTDRLVKAQKWPKIDSLKISEFDVTPMMRGTEQVEENHYSLLVHRKTGKVFLARQGGFKGDWQFFGPISLNGT